jgi:hypothetical protein
VASDLDAGSWNRQPDRDLVEPDSELVLRSDAMVGREQEKRPHCDRVPVAGDDDGVGKDIIRSAKLAPAATISRQRSGSQPTSKPAAKVCLARVSTTIAP